MSADDCAPLPYLYAAFGEITRLLVRSFADLVRSYIRPSGESV